ncbi:hypothetical protein V8C34DRAFT_293496 [Trichoderma compactum]
MAADACTNLVTSIFHTMFRASAIGITKDPSIPPPHPTLQHRTIPSLSLNSSIHSTTILDHLLQTIPCPCGDPFSPPPRASQQTLPIRPKLSIIVSPFWFEMESSLRKLCVGAYSSLASLFFLRSDPRPSPPPSNSTFYAVWNSCPPNSGLSSCIDGMPWTHFDRPRLSSIQGRRKKRQKPRKGLYYTTVSGRDGRVLLVQIILRFTASTHG